MAPKHIFVTGGVVSSLGKGVAASSIGCLLESRGFKVTLQKCDPYLNVDPGTMSPFQHGEVFEPKTARKRTSILATTSGSRTPSFPATITGPTAGSTKRS